MISEISKRIGRDEYLKIIVEKILKITQEQLDNVSTI